jgi:hypothetical protein
MLEDRLAFAESFVDFTNEQQPAWQQLTAAIRAGSAKVGPAPSLRRSIRPRPVTWRGWS